MRKRLIYLAYGLRIGNLNSLDSGPSLWLHVGYTAWWKHVSVNSYISIPKGEDKRTVMLASFIVAFCKNQRVHIRTTSSPQ